MKPFRKNVVLAVDGGGLRGIIPAIALGTVEERMGKSWRDVLTIAAGTSTGSIITAALMSGLPAREITELYLQHGKEIFHKSWRNLPLVKYLTDYQYSNRKLREVLGKYLGDKTLGDLWRDNRKNLVITVRDLVEARTLFIKPYKEKYQDWLLADAVLASTAVPTMFPVVKGRYVDGGVGSYSNPCFIAAFEALFCAGYHPDEVTLLSLGTGRDDCRLRQDVAVRFNQLDWIPVVLGSFLSDCNEQQVRTVATVFRKGRELQREWRSFARGIDFRRFQVQLPSPSPASDDPDDLKRMIPLGEELGRMVLEDRWDSDCEFEVDAIPA
jgi:uncharacterized protein